MKSEIITIGDELLNGNTINTNAAFIGQKLLSLSIEPIWSTVVGDDIDQILQSFSLSWQRADLILVTGGLGPTHDDITKDAICRFFDTHLIHHPHVLAAVQELFRLMNRKMPELVKNQALYPQGCTLIPNRIGSAWGIRFDRDKRIFIAMPGVPAEMISMMEATIIPSLRSVKKDRYYVSKMILTSGIIEAELMERVEDLDKIREVARLAVLPKSSGVALRLSVCDSDPDHAEQKLDTSVQMLMRSIHPWVYSMEDQPLEEVVGKMLKSQNLTIAVAESCTGGLIAHQLTNIPGSSDYFNRGVVVYSNQAKCELLGILPEVINQYGAVSEEVAAQMAQGIRKNANVNIGLATTGIAGPTGETPDKPCGLVYIGISDGTRTITVKHQFNLDRRSNKERFASSALNLTRKFLLKQL